jgi:diguanylate cyclase (GGDEF)-like protein/PAS domain S-box-containing protein
MSVILKIHHLLSMTPVITILGPLLLALAAVAALHYLKLTRQLREQFAAQHLISVELRKLSTAVEHSPASIVVTDCKGGIEYVNPAFCRLTGYSPEEALGQNTSLIKGYEQPAEHFKEMWNTILAGREWRGEFHNKRKDGSLFWELASISPILNEQGEITNFVGVKENITERKELLEYLDQMAHYDELTGLPNRALFFDRLGCLESLSRREGRHFALLFIDLDGFKGVNDRHGHDAGDAVLRETAARLRASIRASDTAARMGGDEFTVILGNLSREADISLIARKILQALSAPISLPGGLNCSIGASIGISLYPEDAQDVETLVSSADTAMYEVKREGKNGYRFYLEAAGVSPDDPSPGGGLRERKVKQVKNAKELRQRAEPYYGLHSADRELPAIQCLKK